MWAEDKIIIVLGEVLSDLAKGADNLGFYGGYREYKVRKGSYYDVKIDFERNSIAMEIANLSGDNFHTSIFPWKHRKIKRLRNAIRYLIDNAEAITIERKQNEAIMKAFPNRVNEAFEDALLKK